jgi:uncharacterized delta-60 repeat protein
MWFRFLRRIRRPSAVRSPHFRPHVDVLEDRCLLSAGALDTTFGGTGVVTTSLKNGSLPQAVVIQPWDGKIVVAGLSTKSVHNNDSLVRYNTDGSLDSTFGSGGIVVTEIGSGGTAALYSSTDTTGNAKKIVEAGGNTLVRFNANGSVDTSFGSRGQVSVTSTSAIVGVVIQPADGKVVIAGNTGGPDFVLTRYNPNGTLDKTFGSGGTATISAPGVAGGPDLEAFALQADGKFVVGGEGGWPSTVLELARITSSGTLDTTFGGGNGYVTTSFGTNDVGHMRLAIYPTTGPDTADAGKIEAAAGINGNPGGNNSGQIGVARFNADGTADGTFGQSGQVITPFPTGGSMAWATAVQADGKIVVAGQTIITVGNWDPSLLRYNTDGSLDTTFGNGGIVAIPGNSIRFLCVAIQADGRIVATGDVNGQFMTARYLPGPEVGTFTAGASTVTAGSNLTLAASNITDGDPSSANPSQYATVTQVAFYAVDSNGNQSLLGYATLSNGTWILDYTVSLASGSYKLFAQVTDSDGTIGDSAFLSLTVQ